MKSFKDYNDFFLSGILKEFKKKRIPFSLFVGSILK